MAITKIDHGQVYRFLNVADNHFLDLYMRETDDGTPIQVYNGNTSNAQRFRAEVKDEAFTLLSLCRKKGEPRRVIKESVDGKSLVTYGDAKGEPNEYWTLEILDAGHGIVNIKNVHSGKALENQGYKKPVKCINADSNDVHQQWKIIIAEHDQAGHTD